MEDSNPISDGDHELLQLVENAARMGWPLPADVAAKVAPLVGRGLVAWDGERATVPDEVKWRLFGEQRSLK